MSSIRQQLEDDAIGLIRYALSRKSNPDSGYLLLVGPYNGEADGEDAPDMLRRRLNAQAPAALVTALGGDFDSISTAKTRWRRTIQLAVYVITDSVRDFESRNRSDVAAQSNPTADPGAYQILEDVFDLLAGQQLVADCPGVLMPVRDDPVLYLDDLTVWRFLFDFANLGAVKKRDWGDQMLTGYRINNNLTDDGGPVNPSPPNPFAGSEGDYS